MWSEEADSNPARVIRPVQQRLPLLAPAIEVAGATVLFELSNVSMDGSPAFDLALVVGTTPANEVAAVPLEPPPRIVVRDPVFRTPNRKRLGRVDAEVIQCGIVAVGTKLSLLEPVGWELRDAVGQVFSAEDSEFEHLLGGQLGPDIGVKMLSRGVGAIIDVGLLHVIVDR